MDMQVHGSEKDAEIIKLNMHLTDEKKKINEIKRSQKSLQSFNNSIPQRDESRLQQQIDQMEEDNDLLQQEVKSLKKKNQEHKKTLLAENLNVQKLKKQNRILESKLDNVPDGN